MEAYNQYKALNEQGRYGQAELYARKALQLSQREFGRDHPHTWPFLNNLALLYRKRRRAVTLRVMV